MRPRVLVGAVLTLAMATAWACGSSTPASPSLPASGGGGGAATAPTTIYVLGGGGSDAFRPSQITVAAGSSVVWMNSDDQPHHIVANDGSFDTGVLDPDQQSAPIALSNAGADYACTIHPGEAGSIKAMQ